MLPTAHGVVTADEAVEDENEATEGGRGGWGGPPPLAGVSAMMTKTEPQTAAVLFRNVFTKVCHTW